MNNAKLKALKSTRALPGFADHFFIAPASHFDANGIKDPEDIPAAPSEGTVADIDARDAIATPTAGMTVEVTDDGQGRTRYYKYDGTVWYEISPAIVALDHAFSLTNGFVKVENTNDRRTMESEHPSVDDVHGEMPMLKFSLPGLTQDNIEFGDMITQEGCIIIAPRIGGQEPLQFGTSDSLVRVRKAASTNGGEGLEYAGFDFEAKAFQKNFILYKGAITEKS